MNYKNTNILFLRNEIIEKQANIFREKFWDKSIPVEIEAIIDFKLDIQINPIKGMMSECGTDAFITPDWQFINVDYDRYMDERYKKRLRFSLAHEIGHFVLHKKIHKQFNITVIKDIYKFYEELLERQYGRLETQANIFAEYLLIPKDKLIIERNKQLKQFEENDDFELEKIDKETLNSYLANPVSNIFGVSEEAAQIALGKLGD